MAPFFPLLFLIAGTGLAIAPARPFPVRCSPFESCPEAVGLWVYSEGKTRIPTQCTTFLVGQDLALTNRHCLPSTAQMVDSPCSGVLLYFPSVGKLSADSVRCKDVVALSNTSDRIDEPDFALVRLERRLDRTALEIDRQGLADLDTVRTWVAEPDWAAIVARNQASAEIRSVDCVVSRRTRAFRDPGSRADFTDPLSRKVPLTTCAASKGNSGAPALYCRADGKWVVRALLDRSAPDDALHRWVRSQGFPLLDTTLSEFAYATNLACVSWNGQPTPPLACRTDSSPIALFQEHRRWKVEVDSAIRCQILTCAGRHMEGRILQDGAWPPFQQALGGRIPRSDALVVPLPGCAPTVGDSSWNAPVWTMRFGFDRDLRWSYRMTKEDTLLPVRARCHGPVDGPRVCRFEGTFPSGTFALRTDTLSRCLDRMASSPR
jgi:hypothetical protein